ncbi:GIY-YIG nuclease family protein [Pontibacter harenae]|uniref:GIY-YIG nuclease family protein n=1 Tax=Pontibacter harenae TaxID=2894083 RepID=UPI001E3D5698|nr:GIY-YIG nuclease family protein [Pontibacter harenae]MCC9167977.1 GIY-YIG nuclease family protein [Pontibacter harenae]
MNIDVFHNYNRKDLLKEFRHLRYVKNNRSYFLYFIFECGECIYVGETSNIFWRMVKHKGKCSDTTVIYLEEYQDKQEVLKLEKHYIRTLKPKFNNRYCLEGQLELFAA